MKVNRVFAVVLMAICLFLGVSSDLRAAEGEAAKDFPEIKGVKWKKGPSSGSLGTIAEIKVPEGFGFLGGDDTRTLLEAMQNPTGGDELGLISPAGLDWFVVYQYDETGYVKDDEKGALDADAMLESIKQGTEEGNKERKKRGWPALNVVGWEQKPRYNEQTHNLEWAVRSESEGKPVINYNTRMLGRGGVMRVTLVTGPDELAATLPKYTQVMAGFDFAKGQKYAEYRQGDKIAKYGLSALVVGGAAAAATKAGVFKYLWKGIVAGGLALAAFLKKLFNGRKSSDIA